MHRVQDLIEIILHVCLQESDLRFDRVEGVQDFVVSFIYEFLGQRRDEAEYCLDGVNSFESLNLFTDCAGGFVVGGGDEDRAGEVLDRGGY